jgi:hypothetical protein
MSDSAHFLCVFYTTATRLPSIGNKWASRKEVERISGVKKAVVFYA